MKRYVNIRKKSAASAGRAIYGLTLAFASCFVFASENCERPRDALETKLCRYTWNDTGYTFEDLDVNLNLTYQAALDRVPEREKLRIEQRAWLKIRNKCEDAKCFNDTYDARIRELAVIPGKSAANQITFFGPDIAVDSDPQLFEAMNRSVTRLLPRSGGLRFFDGGANDFDIVGKGKPGTDKQTCEYILFGINKTFATSCQEPTTPDGAPLKMTPFPGNRREGFNGQGEPDSKFLTATGIELAIVEGQTLFREASGAKCEPFNFFLEARAPKSNEVLWRWVYFYETSAGKICRFFNKINAPQIRFMDSFDYGPSALLPGGDVLVGSVRINPQTGLPRNRSRVAAISQEQALELKHKLVNEFIAANSVCNGKLELCPDPASVVKHLWRRLPEAMKPYYLPAR